VKIQYNKRKISALQDIKRLSPAVANLAIAAPEIQPFGQHICKSPFIIDNQ
jgi:hypothetical protein